MAPKVVELKMQFHCSECKSKILNALFEMRGVQKVVVDEKQNKVTVTGEIEAKDVLKRAKKTGKVAELCQGKPSPPAVTPDAKPITPSVQVHYTVKEGLGCKLIAVDQSANKCPLM